MTLVTIALLDPMFVRNAIKCKNPFQDKEKQ